VVYVHFCLRTEIQSSSIVVLTLSDYFHAILPNQTVHINEGVAEELGPALSPKQLETQLAGLVRFHFFF
jgi:hypothetical protein